MNHVATMAAPLGVTVGRKRRPPSGRAKTLQQKFARNLHTLAGDTPSRDIAAACKVSKVSVSRWFSGESIPEFDVWPALAKSIGVEIRDLIPPNLD